MQAFDIDLGTITALYEKYRDDLARVRRYQSVLHRYVFRAPDAAAMQGTEIERVADELVFLFQRSLRTAMFDDVNAEITYLLIRESRPQTVVEISPAGGWSTSWILNALRDNGAGQLFSYDIEDHATRNVPNDLADGIWTFVQGPIQETVAQLPASIDYLFVDSDHSREFGEWYLENLFPRIRPGTITSIDDVWHAGGADASGGEGTVALDWLAQRGVVPFDAALHHDAGNLHALNVVKAQLELAERINPSEGNTAVFFRMPAALRAVPV